MPDHRFQILRFTLAHVTQVNLMVAANAVHIKRKFLFEGKGVHGFYGCGFVVIRTYVHTLYAQSLVIGQKFYLGEVGVFLLGGFGSLKLLSVVQVRR